MEIPHEVMNVVTSPYLALTVLAMTISAASFAIAHRLRHHNRRTPQAPDRR